MIKRAVIICCTFRLYLHSHLLKFRSVEPEISASLQTVNRPTQVSQTTTQCQLLLLGSKRQFECFLRKEWLLRKHLPTKLRGCGS